MYKILGNDRLKSAMLQKDDGTFWFSWGPDMARRTVIEADFMSVRPYGVEPLMKWFTRYEPPIEIEKGGDWPEAVQERLRESTLATK